MSNHVYVLIRTRWQFFLAGLFKKRYRYFRDCLDSVLRQDYDKISVVILQDCWWKLSGKPRMSRLPKFCRKIIADNSSSAEVLFYSCNSRGAAHSLYNIREIMFRLSSSDDIAVLLDDDDILAYSKAISDIVGKMASGANICVTEFENIGQSSLSIVNCGGSRHNTVVGCNDLNPSMSAPYGKGSLCFVDSLGWTKCYRVSVLKQYHDDLIECFGSQTRLFRFLYRNDAYEDFPEIINLCRKNVKVVGLDKCTHAYRKHAGSITSTPRKRDFNRKRPEYLSLLIRLYNNLDKKKYLDKDAYRVIARYSVVKILTIENILAKFRGDNWLVLGLRNTEKGFFVRRFLEVLRQEGMVDTFVNLLKRTDCLAIDESIKIYKKIENEVGDADSPYKVIYTACYNEAVNGCVDLSNVICDQPTRHRINMIWKERYLYISIVSIYIGLAVAGVWLANGGKIKIDAWQVIVAAVIPLAGGLYGIYARRKDLMRNYMIRTERFCESVKELQRHVMAGLNILMNIKYALEDQDISYRPAKIHFTNLKVLSQLTTSEWDDYIVIDKYDNLPNLRVNIRNIDNSARFMEEYVERGDYDGKEMLKIVEWEIVRYVGYIIRFRFFTENKSFMMLDAKQTSLYVKYGNVLEKIVNEIKVGTKYQGRVEADIYGFYERSINDREYKREILSIGKIS